MKGESLEFLNKLLETPSPSGNEQKIQSVVKRRMSKYSDDISIDVHGNLTAVYNPKGKVRVMLAGHCDQIGLMVSHIDERGYLWVKQVGGINPIVTAGANVVVYTESGEVDGVIGYKPLHLIPSNERGGNLDLSKLWIDIGAKDGAEARKIVSIGDYVTYRLGVTKLANNMIASPGCDNRTGLFVCMEALKIVASKVKSKKTFPVALFAVSTVQEELGLRGARTAAYGIDPHVGIAVDVNHATDNPGADAKEVGVMKLGLGPVIQRGPNINQPLERLLKATAKKKKIPHQIIAAPAATGTDANAMQISRAGIATALISIPNRYMHTQVEVVHLGDLENSAKLIAETILSITARTSFIP